MHFIVSTDRSEADADTRKLIRRHVMLGKNLGKSRRPKRKNPIDLNKGPLSRIPDKVGSDLSFTCFADEIQPSLIKGVLDFSAIAKQVLFPLETCIAFDKRDKKYFYPLLSDAAYLNAVVFSTQAYFQFMRLGKDFVTKQGPSEHFLKAVHLLRMKLSQSNDKIKISDETLKVVLSLASHALMLGDEKTARNHLEGLRKLVDLRGGLTTFENDPKLLIEIFRCDLGLALNTGTQPFYFSNPFLEPFLPYPDYTLSLLPKSLTIIRPRSNYKSTIGMVDLQLIEVWEAMYQFCFTINLAATIGQKIPKELLLDTMASVMYRLISMTFGNGSVDEAIRLGLLAFSSNVFLQWRDLRLPYFHFPTRYKSCLMSFDFSDVHHFPLLLWLLVIGSISVLSKDDDLWIKRWLRKILEFRKAQSWNDMQDILKSYMWIEMLHDEPAKMLYDSVRKS